MPNFKPWLWREVRLFELRILKTIARHYSIQKWSSSKERVGSREDVTSSNQTTQQLDGIIFSKASVDKKHTTKDKTWPSHSSSAYLISHVCLDVLIGRRHILPWPNSLLNLAIFELSNGGQFYRQFEVKNSDFLLKSWPKIWHGR